MEYASLAQTICKSLSEIFKHRVGFSQYIFGVFAALEYKPCSHVIRM